MQSHVIVDVNVSDDQALALLESRRDWYRIPARESEFTRLPDPRPKDGDWVEFTRRIERAGYWLSPMDMPEEEAIAAAYRYLAQVANQYREDVPANRFVSVPGDFSPGLGIDEVAVRAVVTALNVPTTAALRRVLLQVRQQWHQAVCHRLRHLAPDIDTSLRTFWYVDDDGCSQFMKVRARRIGRYHPGHGPYGWDDEAEPPYLETLLYQQVYQVSGWGTVLVHPLDVKDGKEQISKNGGNTWMRVS